VPEAFKILGGKNLYIEKWVAFARELAVMVHLFIYFYIF